MFSYYYLIGSIILIYTSYLQVHPLESRPTEGPFLQGPNPEKVHFRELMI